MLSKKTMQKTFWRSFPLQGCFNYERQQTVGWLYGLVPGLKEIRLTCNLLNRT